MSKLLYQNLRYKGSMPVVKTFGSSLDAATINGVSIIQYVPSKESPSDTYTVLLSVNDNNYGYASGGGNYNSGATVTLTAEAYTGCIFVGWYDTSDFNNPVSTSSTYSFTITGNVALQAVFSVSAVQTYTLTLSANDSSYGTVSHNGTGNEFNSGTYVTVYAVANTGYVFTAWYDANDLVNPVSTSSTYSFYIANNTSLVAYFEVESQQQICPSCSGSGTIWHSETCPSCGGTGWIDMGEDPITGIPMTEQCPMCYGTGIQDWTETCPTCDGTGYVSGGGGGGETYVECSNCNGTGVVDSWISESCPECGGSGWMDEIDPETGDPIPIMCQTCMGSGFINMETSISCPICSGTGHVLA